MLTGCKQRQHGIEVVAQAGCFISHDALEFWTELQNHPEQARRFRPRNGRMYYVQARRGEEALWTGYFDRKSKAKAFWQALEKGKTLSFDLRHSPLPSFDEWLRYEPDVTFYWFGTQALTGTSASIQTWTVDATWNNAKNSVQVIGPGGNGAARQSSTVGGCGGGAGEFTKRSNVALTPSGTMYYLLPAGGSVMDALANDTNLTLQSEAFDDGANWPDTVGATIAANSTANPVDGSVNADSLVEDGTTGNHLRGSSFQTIFANQTHIVSVYVQAGIRSAVEVRCFATGYANFFSCAFDLSNQTLIPSTGGSGVVAGQSITPLANNWFRIAVWGTLDAVSTTASTYILASNGSISYAGSNGSTALIIFGAQRNYGSTLNSYVSTTTAATYSNLAKAGTNATTTAAGAHQTGGQGDTVNEGGDGFKPLTGNAVGGGGGGAGGPSGAGTTSTGSAGGAADNGTVTQPTSTNANGVAGTEFGTQGSGTGASGRSGAGDGFTGGLYGGAGSGCGTAVAGAGGGGAQAIIFLTWLLGPIFALINVPVPASEIGWLGAPKASLTLASLAAAQPKNKQIWRYDYVPPPDWAPTSENLDADTLQLLSFKPRIAKLWRYDHDSDVKPWRPTPETLNVPAGILALKSSPFFKLWRYDPDADVRLWAPTSENFDSDAIQMLGQKPPLTRTYRPDTNTDTALWTPPAEWLNAWIALNTTATSPFSKEWFPNYSPDALWLGTPLNADINYIPAAAAASGLITKAPFFAPRPPEHFAWYATPLNADPLTLTANTNEPFNKLWRYDYAVENQPLWLGSPVVSRSIRIPQKNPFFKLWRWDYAVENQPLWLGAPVIAKSPRIPQTDPRHNAWAADYTIEAQAIWIWSPQILTALGIQPVPPTQQAIEWILRARRRHNR